MIQLGAHGLQLIVEGVLILERRGRNHGSIDGKYVKRCATVENTASTRIRVVSPHEISRNLAMVFAVRKSTLHELLRAVTV